MQIATTHKQTKKVRSNLKLLLPAIAALLLMVAFAFMNRGASSEEYFCDMEKTTAGGNRFKGGWTTFSNGKSQTDLKAFSGKYSARCSPDAKYGPGISLTGVSSGDIVQASVWRQSDEGMGAIVFQGEWGQYYISGNKADKVQNGWELLRLKDTIPLGVRNSSLKVYPLLTAPSGAVYFDNIKIKHTKSRVVQPWNDSRYDAPELTLQLEENSLNKLRIKRSEAFATGNLITEKKDLVQAKLKDGQKEVDVKTRLKGDLLDHLQGNKWSFRILAENGQAWNGMHKFSVHNSASRAHLHEWIFHQLLERENVLTTQYDFIKFNLNDEALGIYAYEEHFDTPLLLRQKREAGPIIRINEDGLWQYASKGLANYVPWYESAHIEPFDSKNIMNDDAMKQQFIHGQNLLYDFVQGKNTPEDIFDTDLFAKSIAIMDICMAWHAFGPGNQRFYYNSITGKLEPIGYDGYTDDGTRWYTPPHIFGANVNSRVSEKFYFRVTRQYFHHYLFNDYDFMEKYLGYLEDFSSNAYLEKFLTEKMDDIKSREKFVQQEYQSYSFDKDKVFKNATAIQKVLYPAQHVTLKAYKDESGNIVLENYHFLPIEIIGFGDKTITTRPPQRLITESYNKELPARRYTVPAKGRAKFVFCKTLGTSKVQKLPIFKWQIPETKINPVKANIAQLQNRTGIHIAADSTILLKNGVQTLDKDLLIPEGYKLRILAGTELHLAANVSIVSYGPVFFEGTKERPIKIIADQGGQGILVLNAKEKSQISNTVFTNLNARNKNGQIANGGVTFYKTAFACQNCSFQDTRAKDALSMIHAEYLLQDCRFNNSSGDAIDANNSKGQIRNTTITQTGKDAIEITGGYAEVAHTDVEQAFGASLNAGRSAFVEITGKYTASNCEHGIKASDLANVVATKVDLKSVKQGFVAFEKMAAYGSASLNIKDYSVEDVDQVHVIDHGANVLLKNKKIDVN